MDPAGIKECFDHLCNARWHNRVIHPEEETKSPAFSLWIDGKDFLVVHTGSCWKILSRLNVVGDWEEIGFFHARQDLTSDHLIGRIKSLFDPKRQEKIKTWKAFVQTIAWQAEPNFSYARYNAIDPKFASSEAGFIELFQVEKNRHHNARTFCVYMPFKQQKNIWKTLNTTAQIVHNYLQTEDKYQKICIRDTVNVRAPKSAHEILQSSSLYAGLISDEIKISGF